MSSFTPPGLRQLRTSTKVLASEVSAYVTLPPTTDPNLAQLQLPTDGSLPSYDDLLAAINKVLASDPGPAGQDLTALTTAGGPLTVDQCRNIAYEIVWGAHPPLPSPHDSLENMYTDPPNDGSFATGTTTNSNEQSRQQFQGELNSYYATRNANVELLAKFVYGWQQQPGASYRAKPRRTHLYNFPSTRVRQPLLRRSRKLN